MIIDCSLFDSKLSLHEYLKKELNFPEYYGKNLDALFDLLTERIEETEIIIENFDKLKENLNLTTLLNTNLSCVQIKIIVLFYK